MTQKTTELTLQQLNIYPSAQMIKKDFGGGLMRATPLTGELNEIFPPRHGLAEVNGDFDARLLYFGFLTEGLEKLYGTYLIVGEEPEAENVHILLTPAAYYGEEFANARRRIESYSSPAVPSRMTLLNKALADSKTIRAYQRGGEIPRVGDRYCFKNGDDVEYFRIAQVSSRTRTYTDEKGDDFIRDEIKIKANDAFIKTHVGVEYPSTRYQTPPDAIYETDITDAGAYYGISKMVEDATKDSVTIQVKDVYKQLAPTSVTEQNWVDQYPSTSTLWLPTGEAQTVFSGLWVEGDLHLPFSVMPGSVKLAGWVDTAQGYLEKDTQAIVVDYERGILKSMIAGNHVITAKPATQLSNATCSAYFSVDQTTQGTEWSPFLNPKPAAGSTTIAWVTNRKVYYLRDAGDYQLRDAAGELRGEVTSDGSLDFSLPDLPDVGSKIVVQWSPDGFYYNLDDGDTVSAISPVPPTDNEMLLQTEGDLRPIVPGSISFVKDGVTVTDSHGQLVGATGNVSYAEASIRSDLTGGVTMTSQRYTGQKQSKVLTLSQSAGGNLQFSIGEPVQPGTLNLQLQIIADVHADGSYYPRRQQFTEYTSSIS